MLFLNLKNYEETTGANFSPVMDALRKLNQESPEIVKHVFVVASNIDLRFGKNLYPELNFVAQHVDNKKPGPSTGSIVPENLLKSEIEYSFLNHAEHRVWDENIVTYIKDIQSTGLKLIVCVESLEEVRIALEAQPFAIAFENKDLIGTGRSISSERPDSVVEFINLVKGKCKAIMGAGVASGEDIEAGIKLGADGAIVSSRFCLADDKYAKALELAKPFA